MQKIKYYILAIILLFTVSCKSQYDALLASSDVDLKYAGAFDYFNKGKFQKAAQLFESLSVLTSGTSKEDTVLYYWGLSNYRHKDFYTAETNFTKFIESFPRSPFASQASYLNIDCLYRQTLRYELDQVPTRRTVKVIKTYLKVNPNITYAPACRRMLEDLEKRLDKKAYKSAYLYYKMEDYKASTVALKNVLKEKADNFYREEVLYYIAMSSYKYAQLSIRSKQKERYLVFIDDYLNFIGEYPKSKLRASLDSKYEKVQKLDLQK